MPSILPSIEGKETGELQEGSSGGTGGGSSVGGGGSSDDSRPRSGSDTKGVKPIGAVSEARLVTLLILKSDFFGDAFDFFFLKLITNFQIGSY